MKIIDAHMHYYDIDKFYEVAENAGHENTAACWQQICQENNIVFAVAMGNSEDAPSRYGGSTPRLINLSGPFDEKNYNQPLSMGYCLGVKSEDITLANSEKTAQEFEHYLSDPHCLGIKFYPGYRPVFIYDERHYPLFELARHYNVPVAVHTGDTATPAAKLRYAHPLTVDEVAADFPDVQFVICHCGNPWLLDATEVATKNDNVAVDLSGLLEGIPGPHFYRQNQGYFDYLGMWLRYMNRWDKLMYGSDWPLINIPDYIAIMRQLIPEEHQEAFFYSNALRVYSRIQKIL